MPFIQPSTIVSFLQIMMMLTLRMAALGCGVILKVTTQTGGFIGPTRKLLILDLVLIIPLDQVCIFALPLLGACPYKQIVQIKQKEPLASTDDTLFDLLYREKKSLRHVAMVAKNLDDNKAKKSLKSLFALF